MNLVPCTVLENRVLSPGNHLLTLRVPRSFARPKPGQFVHLRVCSGGEFMLRRPYSIEGGAQMNDVLGPPAGGKTHEAT